MTEPLHIDLATAQRLVGELIAEKGAGYVYPHPPLTVEGEENEGSCYYVHTPDLYPDNDPNRPAEPVPGCIVGHVLHRAGVSLDDLRRGDGDAHDPACEPAGGLLSRLERDGVLTYSDDVSLFLGRAQRSQDLGDTWGVAAEKAAQP